MKDILLECKNLDLQGNFVESDLLFLKYASKQGELLKKQYSNSFVGVQQLMIAKVLRRNYINLE
jgi:hypothetical protein